MKQKLDLFCKCASLSKNINVKKFREDEGKMLSKNVPLGLP